jgi:prepilin-type N-terminal cleavage/methylation domain-containing protein
MMQILSRRNFFDFLYSFGFWNLFGTWNLDFGASNVEPRKGFTLIEVLIVVTLFAIISGIIAVSLSRYTQTQVIAGTAAAIASSLEDARSRTLSSRGASPYGVHLEDGSITLFKGDSYAVGNADNEVTSLDPRADITLALNGGGSDIVFERLSGETANYGTISIALADDATNFKIITLQETGLLSYD